MTKEFDFYIVPTPIGNLGDITFRAVEVLKMVDIIACEDSRVTQKLLNHYNINTKTISYHKFNEKQRVTEFVNKIKQGKKIALVSDAGMPMICDPGSILLKELKNNGITVTSLAGPCAVPTFLSQIPRDSENYTFIGFFPKTEQFARDVITRYADTNLVFYESPQRIISTLEYIKKIRGEVNVALSRELTKLFEETIVDTISNTISYYKDGIKGEIVCMIYSQSNYDEFCLKSKILKLKNENFKSKEIAKILSTLYGYKKNDVYKFSMSD